MNRKEEIRNEAAERYKDSEYRAPNMYCFIQGAEWADANPLKGWNKFSDENMPEKGDIIALAIIDEKLRGCLKTIVNGSEFSESDNDSCNHEHFVG